MKAIRLHAFGPASVLQYEDAPAPAAPLGSDIVVAIKAASVNGADWKVRSGKSAPGLALPHVPGRDFSGVVLAAGPLADLAVGDEVVGVCPGASDGGYAQQIAISAALVAHKPAGLSHMEAAAMALAGLTALVSLEDTLGLQRGEKILVQGGAGGVGSMAVQMARHLGATVIATARTVNHDYVRRLGAHQVIDYTQQNPGDVLHDCDAAFDTIGGSCIAPSFAVLRPGGRAAFIGDKVAPVSPRPDVTALRPVVDRSRARLERVLAYFNAGAIQAPEVLEMPLADARRAHELSEAGHVRGKIVLVP